MIWGMVMVIGLLVAGREMAVVVGGLAVGRKGLVMGKESGEVKRKRCLV